MTENLFATKETFNLIEGFIEIAKVAYTKAEVVASPEVLAQTALNMYILLITQNMKNNKKTDFFGIDVESLLRN